MQLEVPSTLPRRKTTLINKRKDNTKVHIQEIE